MWPVLPNLVGEELTVQPMVQLTAVRLGAGD